MVALLIIIMITTAIMIIIVVVVIVPVIDAMVRKDLNNHFGLTKHHGSLSQRKKDSKERELVPHCSVSVDFERLFEVRKGPTLPEEVRMDVLDWLTYLLACMHMKFMAKARCSSYRLAMIATLYPSSTAGHPLLHSTIE